MILPFKTDTIIHSQCWTFNRTAIIESESYGDNWSVSKYNIFLDENYNAYFDDLDIYDYYHGLFLIKTINLKSIESVIDYFKLAIEKRFYISINYDYKLLGWNTEYEEQELLFYGFDDIKKIFYLSKYNFKKNRHESATITYHQLLDIIFNLKNCKLNFENLQTILTSKYLTLLKPKKQKLDQNITLIRCLQKVKNEICYCRSKGIKQVFGDKKQVHKVTGLGCVLEIQKLIDKVISSNEIVPDIRKSLYKLYEHRLLMIKTLMSLLNSLQILEEESINLYNECTLSMKKCYLLAQKYTLDNKYKDMVTVSETLKYIFDNEYALLTNIYEKSKCKLINIM